MEPTATEAPARYMNFSVSPDFYRRFRQTAIDREVRMAVLARQALEEFLERETAA